jgi:L-iditol 2-dehydrogenase
MKKSGVSERREKTKKSMRAAILKKAKQIEVQEVARPQIKNEEVLIRVKAVGVCGSDAHFYRDGRLAGWIVKEPLILGHECAGEIAQAGRSVEEFQVGDRVIVEPGVPCRRCEWCKRGEYNLCPDIRFMAIPGVDGAFAEYVGSAADFVYPLPDGVSYEEGALVEPLSVAIETIKSAKVELGDSVAILGAGPIGILCLQAARAGGATDIYITDIDENRLSYVTTEFNPTVAINAKEKDVVEVIKRITDDRGVDVVLEAAGTIDTFKATSKIVKKGGMIVLTGIPPFREFPFQASQLFDQAVQLRTIFRYTNTFPRAIRLVDKGMVDLKSLITHRFSLDKTKEALELTMNREDGVIKAVVIP